MCVDELTKQQIKTVCNLLLHLNSLSVDDIIKSLKDIGFSIPSLSDLMDDDGKWKGLNHSIFGHMSEYCVYPHPSRFWINFPLDWEDESSPPVESISIYLVYHENYEIIFEHYPFDKYISFGQQSADFSRCLMIEECICDKNLKYFHEFILKNMHTIFNENSLAGNEPIEHLASLK